MRSQLSHVALASMAQRGEHQNQMAEVVSSMLNEVTFCCWIFLVKPVMPILCYLYCQFCVFWKDSIEERDIGLG